MSPRTLKEQLEARPVDAARVNELAEEMRREVRAYRLAEIRTRLQVSQVALAREAHISQNRVSQIERGNIEHTQIDTLRKYIEALGGTVEVTARFGSERFDLVS
ncbi:XRE family transcriptional regulator [Paenarthrobacter sp. NPDC090520]|uniref:XRE family transcriptional regulator n=1 Tax=unclassified Paenarthrobacter TaxID=2634190 RepID=UPI003806DCF4